MTGGREQQVRPVAFKILRWHKRDVVPTDGIWDLLRKLAYEPWGDSLPRIPQIAHRQPQCTMCQTHTFPHSELALCELWRWWQE